MSRALTLLSQVIRSRKGEADESEVRAHLVEFASEIAEAFGVSVEALRDQIASYDDDTKLRQAFEKAIKIRREQMSTGRFTEQCNEGDVAAARIAETAKWSRERKEIKVDLARVLAAAIFNGDTDVLIFASDEFAHGFVALPMRAMRRLRAQRKLVARSTATLDETGLHVRWSTKGRVGGLNFRPKQLVKNSLHVRCALPALTHSASWMKEVAA